MARLSFVYSGMTARYDDDFGVSETQIGSIMAQLAFGAMFGVWCAGKAIQRPVVVVDDGQNWPEAEEVWESEAVLDESY